MPELDALRGVAAMVVVFNHALRVLPSFDDGRGPDNAFGWLLADTPLHLLWAGTEAVTLFFLLSGFVLALPFHGARHGDYSEYLTRRICRIWIPYITVVALALAVRAIVAPHTSTGWGGVVKNTWEEPFTAVDAVVHLLLVLVIPDGNQSIPVIWSLTHEMRISIIFPLIMWAVLRYRWFVPVGVALMIAAVAVVAGEAVGAQSNAMTGPYMVLFVVGALMAKHRAQIISQFGEMSTPSGWGVFSVGAACCTYPFWLAPTVGALHGTLGDTAVVGLGAAIFLALAIGSSNHRAILHRRVPQFLGRISYSLYLVHALVIMVAVRTLAETLPLEVVLILAVAVSLVAADVCQRLVEKPAINLGRTLAHRIRARRLTPGDSRAAN